MAVERAATAGADWQECRTDPDYAPAKAWTLLAAWGRLLRVYLPAEMPGDVAYLADLVRQESRALLSAALAYDEPAAWLDAAQRLDRACDNAVSEPIIQELDGAAGQLFEQLDRESLAVCMGRQLLAAAGAWGADEAQRQALTRALQLREEQLAAGEQFLAGHVDAFLPAAALAGTVLNAERPDLAVSDPELHRTLNKHWLLEEAWDEAEAPAQVFRLNDLDRRAIQAAVAGTQPSARATPPAVISLNNPRAFARSALPRLTLAAAASSGPWSTSLRRLAWHSPAGDLEARLALPAADLAVSGSVAVTLSCFVRASGEHAQAVIGHLVRLAGIERRFDQRARVSFTLQELNDVQQDLLLEVAGEPWQPAPNYLDPAESS